MTTKLLQSDINLLKPVTPEFLNKLESIIKEQIQVSNALQIDIFTTSLNADLYNALSALFKAQKDIQQDFSNDASEPFEYFMTNNINTVRLRLIEDNVAKILDTIINADEELSMSTNHKSWIENPNQIQWKQRTKSRNRFADATGLSIVDNWSQIEPKEILLKVKNGNQSYFEKLQSKLEDVMTLAATEIEHQFAINSNDLAAIKNLALINELQGMMYDFGESENETLITSGYCLWAHALGQLRYTVDTDWDILYQLLQ